ncbi:MAG: chemotaxis response regulator protein-glutamate methylesterase [Desulfovibrionaceae bacterium]|nr:chemotaxis response regulator protein-glutamate methylesterase [Desulfovibrionaceae bacterium]MDD4951800.1 chemotaxis response regulator protein-glutamate methylesterase [Desulfovibrionaceae bacterium]
MTRDKIKVLVVDDSALVRRVLSDILGSDPDIEVLGAAGDPFVAAEKMRLQAPDVLTLDIEMPRMDGLTFLRKIMTQHPLPVVICSSLAPEGGETALRALDLGAVEVIAKPRLGAREFLEESRVRICDAVKAAFRARPRTTPPARPARAPVSAGPRPFSLSTTEKVILVGASTGGTEALRVFLEALPSDCPAVAIVQHMPEHFTAAFAKRLDNLCAISVKEAEDSDAMLRGRALIAPGDRHMLLGRSGTRYFVQIRGGPMVSRHRPSVDVLFRSGARFAGRNAVALIMTGMGDDGACGMRELFDAGAWTVAQDEASCVVFGMPQEAVKLGGVRQVLSLEDMAAEAVRRCLA